MQRLTAKELQRRYRAGERRFANVDLSGESLRGMNLKGIDLSGADLSRTDIRGTNFSEANLVKAQFFASTAGAQFYWLGLHLLSITVPAALAAYFTGYFYALIIAIIWANTYSYLASYTINITTSSIANIPSSIYALATKFPLEFFSVASITLATILGLVLTLNSSKIYAGNTSRFFWVTLGIIAFLCACALTAIFWPITSVIRFAIGFPFLLTFIFCGGLFLASLILSLLRFTVYGFLEAARNVSKFIVLTFALAGVKTGSGVGFIIVFAVIWGAHIGSHSLVSGDLDIPNANVVNLKIVTTGAIILCIASYVAFLSSVKCTVLNGLIDDSIGLSGSWVSSLGGTKFIESNLTDASLEEAILQSTDFSGANLTRTRFHLAKKIHLARLSKTDLTDFKIRNLLVTLRGSGQSYAGFNLKGVHLAGADLSDVDFAEADISNATLEGATLERANLTKTQALGTNFHQTILTGATLEAWNIDSTTKLDGAICDYVYLLQNYQERRPNSGSFAPGDFTKLFQEVLDTIDLIFQNGIDWKAFIQTFNQIQVQYENADLAVQSIENKGDGVVVVKLHAAPGADKPAIHQSFTEIYQLAFAEAEKEYKAQLHAKDREIQIYRQQSADMRNIAELLAQRPINVQNVGNNVMQGNDNSRNVNIHGSANQSIIQAGDGNTAEQHITLPPPERVNIQAELAALKEILAGFQRPIIDAVMVEVEEEIAKPNPDKSVVATTLETGLTYARNLQGFAEAMDQLRPHVQNAASWLGEHGTKLLPLVGLL